MSRRARIILLATALLGAALGLWVDRNPRALRLLTPTARASAPDPELRRLEAMGCIEGGEA